MPTNRDIGAGVRIEEFGVDVSAHYKTEFTAPFSVPPCDHVFLNNIKKGFLRRKEWNRTFHGRPDGLSEVTIHCIEGGRLQFPKIRS